MTEFTRPTASPVRPDVTDNPLAHTREGAPLLGQFADALITENEVVTLVRRLQDTTNSEQNEGTPFVPTREMLDRMPVIASNPSLAFGVWDEAHLQAKNDRLQAEGEARARLATEGGSALLLSGAAGILSPTTLLPVGAVKNVSQIGRGAYVAARAGAVGISLQESGLQATSEYRTAEESLYGIGGGVVLGGVLGGALSGIQRAALRSFERGLSNALDSSVPSVRASEEGIFFVETQDTRVELATARRAAYLENREMSADEIDAVYAATGRQTDDFAKVDGLWNEEGQLMLASREVQEAGSVTEGFDPRETVEQARQRHEDRTRSSETELGQALEEARTRRAGADDADPEVIEQLDAEVDRIADELGEEPEIPRTGDEPRQGRRGARHEERERRRDQARQGEAEARQRVADDSDAEASERLEAANHEQMEGIDDATGTPRRIHDLSDIGGIGPVRQAQLEELGIFNLDDLKQWLTGHPLESLPFGPQRTARLRRVYATDLQGEAVQADVLEIRQEIDRAADAGEPANSDLLNAAAPLSKVAAAFGGAQHLARILDNPQGQKIRSRSDLFRLIMDNMVESDLMTEGQFAGHAAPESAELGMVGWRNDINGAFRDIKDVYSDYRKRVTEVGEEVPISFDDFDAAIYDALERGQRANGRLPPSAIRDVEKSASILRQRVYLPIAGLLDEQLGTATKVDPFAYVMRIYDVHAISKNRLEFETAIGDSLKGQVRQISGALTDAQSSVIENMASRWVDGVLTTPFLRTAENFEEFAIRVGKEEGFRVPGGSQGNSGLGRAGRARKLGRADENLLAALGLPQTAHIEVPTEVLGPWLRRSSVESTMRYLNTRIPDLELAKKFNDDPQLTATLEMFDAHYQDLIEAAPNKTEAAELRRGWHKDRTYIERTRDVLRHTIALPDDPASFAGMTQRAAQQARNYNVFRISGGFFLVALADIGNTALALGVRNTFGNLFSPWISESAKTMKAMQKAELDELGVIMQDVLGLRASSLWDVTEFAHYNTRAEQAMNSLTHKMFTANLLTPWTNVMRTVAGQGILNEFVRVAKLVREGSAGPGETARLLRAHVPEALAVEILEQVEVHGSINPKGQVVLGLQKWDSQRAPELRRLLRNLIIADTNRAVVTPGAGDVPIFLKTHTGKLIGQFKSFGFSITQKVVIPGMQGLAQGDTRILNGIPLTVAMGSIVYMLKEAFNNRELETDPGRVIQEGVVRSDLWGVLAPVDDIGTALSAGRVSLRGTLGPDTHHGYQPDSAILDVARNVLGPTFDSTMQLGKASGAFAKFVRDGGLKNLSAKEVRALRRILPLQNLFYADFLFDAAENGVASRARTERNQARTTDSMRRIQ